MRERLLGPIGPDSDRPTAGEELRAPLELVVTGGRPAAARPEAAAKPAPPAQKAAAPAAASKQPPPAAAPAAAEAPTAATQQPPQPRPGAPPLARLSRGGLNSISAAACDTDRAVVVMRHGHRQDEADPTWTRVATRPWDPPLSTKGRMQVWRAWSSLTGRGGPAGVSTPCGACAVGADRPCGCMQLHAASPKAPPHPTPPPTPPPKRPTTSRRRCRARASTSSSPPPSSAACRRAPRLWRSCGCRRARGWWTGGCQR